jgi:Uma2 family endonuclease
VALVVEVADSSLEFDRGWKRRIYAAHAGLYWVVNLIDRVVEVYSVPQGDGDQANYTVSRTYGSTDAVPLTVGEHEVALVPVAGLLP